MSPAGTVSLTNVNPSQGAATYAIGAINPAYGDGDAGHDGHSTGRYHDHGIVHDERPAAAHGQLGQCHHGHGQCRPAPAPTTTLSCS